MFNLLVTLMTLIAAAFVVVWFLRPDFRRWIGEPKYRFLLEQEKKFEKAMREQASEPAANSLNKYFSMDEYAAAAHL